MGNCIESIFSQTYDDFELIIIDDGSTDNTPRVIESLNDPRIRYIRFEQNCGIMGKLRSIGVNNAAGEFIFFTDSDCAVRPDWIEIGLRAFAQFDAPAVEGRIIYNKDGYKATLSDIKKENETGGLWMTGNMAYRKTILTSQNFNESYRALEDRELGLRISRTGRIPFIREMVVYHSKGKRGIKRYFKEVSKIYINEKIRLYRDYNDKNDLFDNYFHIFNPGMLLIMLFPPLVLYEFVTGRIKSIADLKLLPFLWPKAIYLRLTIWIAAFKHGINVF